VKLKEALNIFLMVDRAEQTRDTYCRFLTRFVNAIGPERPLELIRPEDLDVFVFEMRTRQTKYGDHPRRPTETATLSSTTVYRNVKMIKSFFTWCVRRGYLAQSPARFLTNSKPPRPLGQGKAATDDELKLLLAGAQFNSRDLAIVLLLAQSGCRAGEAARLRVTDLDLDNGWAWVDGKGDKRRRIFFGEETVDALRAWLEVRPAVDHDCVFTSTRGKTPLTPRSLSQVVRRLSAKVGLTRQLGAHSLRHRVGMTFARQHVPVRVAQAYLGHARPEITFGYYQDVEDRDLRSASQLLRLGSSMTDEGDRQEKKKAVEIFQRLRRTG
jgi:integrase/recombinase XerC